MVIEMIEEKAVVARPSWCIACGHCMAICPVGAVRRNGNLPETFPSNRQEVSLDSLEGLLKERRSVRIYKSDPVPREVWDRILDTCRFAPTGTNSQNVAYVAIHDSARIRALRDKVLAFYRKLFARVASPVQSRILALLIGKKALEQLRFYLPTMEMAMERVQEGKDPLFHGAPALLLVHTPKGDSSSSFNGAVALYTCCLVAEAMGLGSCFNGFLEAAVNHDKTIKSFVEIPKGRRCTGAMTLGYRDVQYHRLVERRPAQVNWI